MTGSMDGSLIDKALSYGCWCQISGSSKGILPGKGQPVDELDKICKSWSQCRSCNAIDNRDSGCDPNNVVLEVGMSLNGGRINCLNNLTPCSRNNCECDEQFAFELHKMNPDFVTEYDGSSIKSGFNHVSECRIVGENSGGEDHAANGSNSNNGSQCCGEYPNRFLFNPLGGERACCRNVTYSTYRRECCNNSFLTSVGTCQ